MRRYFVEVMSVCSGIVADVMSVCSGIVADVMSAYRGIVVEVMSVCHFHNRSCCTGMQLCIFVILLLDRLPTNAQPPIHLYTIDLISPPPHERM